MDTEDIIIDSRVRGFDEQGPLEDKIVAALIANEFVCRDVIEIRLAFVEALMNCLKHGHKLDRKHAPTSGREVIVMCTVTSAACILILQDEGEGFDPDSVPDPSIEENLESGSGRGVMLMHHFMDMVEYIENGNIVMMRKDKSEERET